MAKPSWVTLDKSSGTGGGSVKVTASKNTGSSSRSGTLTVKTASGLTKTVSIQQSAPITVRLDCYIFFLPETGASIRLDTFDANVPPQGFTLKGTSSGKSFSTIIAPSDWKTYVSGRKQVTKTGLGFETEGALYDIQFETFTSGANIYNPSPIKPKVDLVFSNVKYDATLGWGGNVQFKLQFVDDKSVVTLGSSSDLAMFEITANIRGTSYTGMCGFNGVETTYPFDFYPNANPSTSENNVSIIDAVVQNDTIYTDFNVVNQ